jgi:PAS domain S-box-containing protein
MMGADSGPIAASSDAVDPIAPNLDEVARIAALRDLRVLDTDPDPRFDRIVRLAAKLMNAPRAAIILIDEHRLWMKARVGLPDGEWPRRATLVESVLRTGQPVFCADVRADPRFAGVTADSAADARFYAAVPLIEPGGQIVGALSVGDVEPHPVPTASEQSALADLAALAMEELTRDAEAAIARERSAIDRERVDLALSAAGLAAYEWDLETDRLLLTDRLRVMLGLEGESLPIRGGALVMDMIPEEDRAQARATVAEAMAGSGRFQHEHRIVRTDGGTIWVSSSGVVVRRPDGAPKRLIGVLQDITSRKIAEEQRETLVAELDHRVKNVLAAVQSLAAQSARKAPSLDGFLKTFAGRLKSMASAHDLLTATRWRGAGMQNIAAAELGGLAPGQTRWEGPDVLLTPRAANAMSLALHELATNAVKFGALSTDQGRVEVRWRRSESGGLELQWTETGGPPVSAPTRRGFGATLLHKVTGRELGGEARIEHRREGVRVVLTAGATALASAPVAAEQAEEAPVHVTRSGASGGPPRPAQPVRIEGLKVLIVEDALLLALELEAGLAEAGAEIVGSAGDLEEAQRMTGLDIDAAVLDANLNGESVQPVADALAARGVPFVFATGYGDDKIMPQNFTAPVIRKPYDVTQVVAALAEVTHRV